MSVFKRTKDGPYWYRFMFNGERIQESTKQFSKDAAKDIESVHRTALAKGEAGIKDKKAERKRVSDLLDVRIADLSRRKKRTDAAEKARRELGSYWADELTGNDLDKYFELKRSEDVAVATITNTLRELTSAYLLADLKAPKMRPLTAEEKNNVRTNFFEKSEFETLREQLPEDLRDFCCWGYLTGMRFSSIANLRWEHISNDNAEMTLPGQFMKAKQALKLPLVGELHEIIARRRAARAIKGEMPSLLVFHRAGKQVRQFRLEWIEAALAAKLGKMSCPKCSAVAQKPTSRCSCAHCRVAMKYDGVIFHDFRRTAARDMIRAGVPQTIAMKITGHKTTSIFDRYNVSDTTDLREALAKTYAYRDDREKKVVAIGRR